MSMSEEQLARRWEKYYHLSAKPTPIHDSKIISEMISTKALEKALKSVGTASKNRNKFVFQCLVELTAREDNVTAIMEGVPNFVADMVSAYQQLVQPDADALHAIANISYSDNGLSKILEACRDDPDFLTTLLQVPREARAPAITLVSNMVFDEDFAQQVLQDEFPRRLIGLLQDKSLVEHTSREQLHKCVDVLAKHDVHGVIRGNDVIDALIEWVCDNPKYVNNALLALYRLASMEDTVFDKFKDDMVCALRNSFTHHDDIEVRVVAIKLLALYIGKTEGGKMVDRTKTRVISTLHVCAKKVDSLVSLWLIICLALLCEIYKTMLIDEDILTRLVDLLEESNKWLENDNPSDFPFDLIMLAIRRIILNNDSASKRLHDRNIANKLEKSMQLACIKNEASVFIHAFHAMHAMHASIGAKEIVYKKDLLQTFANQFVHDDNKETGSISNEFVTEVSAALDLPFGQILADEVKAKAATVELACENARGGGDSMQDSSYLAQGDEHYLTEDDDSDPEQDDEHYLTEDDDSDPEQDDNTNSAQGDGKYSVKEDDEEPPTTAIVSNNDEPLRKRLRPTIVEEENASEWLRLGLIEPFEAAKLTYTVDNGGGGEAFAKDGEIKPLELGDLQMLVKDGMLVEVLTWCGLSTLSIKRLHAHLSPYKFPEMHSQDLYKFLVIAKVLSQREAWAIGHYRIGLHALCRMKREDFAVIEMPVDVQLKLEKWINECYFMSWS